VSIWTPFMSTRIEERWFGGDHLVYLWPIPVATAAVALICWAGIRKGSGVQTFLSAMTLFLLCFFGLSVSTFPYLVPASLTIWDAAAAPQSQIFSLIGALLFLPLILAYTAFVYWTFRGKVSEGGGYH
jgi:cytochrome bd ubiquinol oxidase subunit II